MSPSGRCSARFMSVLPKNIPSEADMTLDLYLRSFPPSIFEVVKEVVYLHKRDMYGAVTT